MLNRHRRNKIHTVIDGKSWLHNSTQIISYFLDNFNDVFSTDSPDISEDIGYLGFDLLLMEENNNLMKMPSEEEIKACIQALHPLESSGLDGYPKIFFRHY